jgi:hypothetical protein
MYINLTHERGVEEIREYKYPSVMFPFGVQHVCHIPPTCTGKMIKIGVLTVHSDTALRTRSLRIKCVCTQSTCPQNSDNSGYLQPRKINLELSLWYKAESTFVWNLIDP